ncbi:hypothetical protein COU91_00130 [Candidatus Saccharibacteria bacterium CG10_big_fil_rev_8_21_14_0_10_47_8]|nr:MAG: hypothetical protein COU91_00130 [Candidatus Saccharibacteria bacterium CG10_big_fil_rev_8_21_14_0_10_47_8]
MLGIKKFSPVARSIGTVGAVVALAGGVTFAALTSNSVVLADSQFSTGTASLKIWDGDSYEFSAPGFNFTNVVPGTETSAFTFWLKNDGTTDLNVSAEGANQVFTNISDPDKVDLKFTNITAGGSPVTYSVQDLTTGGVDPMPGDTLNPNEENQYSVTVNVDPTTVSGSSASMTSFDLTFTGVQP